MTTPKTTLGDFVQAVSFTEGSPERDLFCIDLDTQAGVELYVLLTYAAMNSDTFATLGVYLRDAVQNREAIREIKRELDKGADDLREAMMRFRMEGVMSELAENMTKKGGDA